MSGAVDTVPVRFSTCGEFAASEPTVTVAVRVVGPVGAGSKTTVSVQKD
jgi:hypothetical protein